MTISRVAPFVLAFAAAAPLAAQAAKVVWHDGAFDGTLAQAKASGRSVLVYFWMEGSQHCSDLWTQTLDTPEATKLLGGFVCHSAKATDKVGRELIQRYHVKTLPSLTASFDSNSSVDQDTAFIGSTGASFLMAPGSLPGLREHHCPT